MPYQKDLLQQLKSYLPSVSMSTGSLRGARGNSGVILSQLIRGFCKELEGKEEVVIEDVAKADTLPVSASKAPSRIVMSPSPPESTTPASFNTGSISGV